MKALAEAAVDAATGAGASYADARAVSLQDGAETSRHELPGPLVAPVAAVGPWLVVPTRTREGWLLGIDSEAGSRVFTQRLDTAVVARPVVRGDQLLVLGRDGRVLSWRLNPVAGSGR